MAKLYIVPTPIGNLDDITLRAVNVLRSVDFILAEDTRTTSFLLKHLGIEQKLRSHHKFNEHATVEMVAGAITAGRNAALVSDAGTPGISDPGFLLVRTCVEAGIEVETLPGATALIPALVQSGFPCDRFCFEGFLPQKKGRMKQLQALAGEERTMIFYESPYRVVRCLEQFAEVFGEDRRVSVSREITKKFEQTVRGTVAEVYAKIEKDIEEGLPLINDVIYSVPKYHFNKRAANAFAARFYLYYQKWDEAVKYATVALTNSPAGSLRNYEELLEYPMNNGATLNTAATYYVSADLTCNFMMATAYSYAGRVFGGYGVGMQYNHGQMIADNEGIDCTNTPFAPYTWKCEPLRFVSGIDKILLPRVPYLIEYLDPVAGTGYRHTVYPLFTAEETLLTRAEAYIMQKEYTAALNDMNLYLSNSCSKYKTLTEANISSWAASVADYDPKNPTPKKPLNPAFEIDRTQEGMIHTLLLLRRYETLHYGLRWFDVKRFGIEIYRRTLTSNDLGIKSVDDTLEVRDNRRAVQLPADVLAADMTPNPR